MHPGSENGLKQLIDIVNRWRRRRVHDPGNLEVKRAMNTDVVEVVLRAFEAVQTRDAGLESEAFAADVDLHWPSELPYGGSTRSQDRNRPTSSQTRDPLQPTEAERDLEARVVSASDDEVVVLWRQKSVTPSGERIDTRVSACIRSRAASCSGARCSTSTPSEVVRFLAA